MPRFTDQTGNTISIDRPPERVISLVPSQSEFLWDIGVRDQLAGITKFCVHPAEMFRTVERVGGTKQLDMEKIIRLQPDLIIGNKEENDRGQIETLQSMFNVWISDINSFDDAYDMMISMGKVFGKEMQVSAILDKLKPSIERTKSIFPPKKTAYFMWNDPYMCAAANTFIHHVLQHSGLVNVFGARSRYPIVDAQELQDAAPELCLLSSEPFPFSENHAGEIREILPGSKILLVDGESFSWYGTRLLKLESYLRELEKKINW
jgi:ABC-type Fe3+-hydroxamate transport system substrate-binding protein